MLEAQFAGFLSAHLYMCRDVETECRERLDSERQQRIVNHNALYRPSCLTVTWLRPPGSGWGGLLFHDPLTRPCDHHPKSR